MAETPEGGPSEGIGVIAAAVVLLISFGSALAMGLPIVTALFGIGSGLSLIALIGHLVPAPSFAPVVASLIGLGGGVDYALFIVTRFREALRAGATPESAVVTAFLHRGPGSAVRRHHSDHRRARPAGAAAAADERRRGRGRVRAGRLAHPPARPARVRRHPARQAVEGDPQNQGW